MGRISLFVIFCCSGCASLGPLNPMRPIECRLLYSPTPVECLPVETDFESVRIETAEGGNLHGLFLEHPSARGVLLYCHGNAGNVVDRLPRLRQLRSDHQLSVLGFDYRGYGASGGKPTEQGLYDDARAARTWLSNRTAVAESDVVLMGRSLGGAVAVELATDGAKGLILESTFTSTTDVGKSHTKWIPVSFLMSQKFESAKKISSYNGPLLQMHGTEDAVVPFRLGRELYKQANSPKRFVTMNGGHNDANHPDYEPLLAEFLNTLYLPPPKSATPARVHHQQDVEFDCRPNSWSGNRSL